MSYWLIQTNSELPHKERVSTYSNLKHNFNFKNINFPTSFKDVKKFHKQNKININIFSLNDKNEVYPLIFFTQENIKRFIDIIHIHMDDDL